MEKELIIFLTDSYSLKTIASGVQEASIEYQLIKRQFNLQDQETRVCLWFIKVNWL